jgi:hypothetical protein
MQSIGQKLQKEAKQKNGKEGRSSLQAYETRETL